jgi:hypothetical protein
VEFGVSKQQKILNNSLTSQRDELWPSSKTSCGISRDSIAVECSLQLALTWVDDKLLPAFLSNDLLRNFVFDSIKNQYFI